MVIIVVIECVQLITGSVIKLLSQILVNASRKVHFNDTSFRLFINTRRQMFKKYSFV